MEMGKLHVRGWTNLLTDVMTAHPQSTLITSDFLLALAVTAATVVSPMPLTTAHHTVPNQQATTFDLIHAPLPLLSRQGDVDPLTSRSCWLNCPYVP
ncbi:hypothetical protein SRHO_G00158140 [Serrasalmus rhombeus]